VDTARRVNGEDQVIAGDFGMAIGIFIDSVDICVIPLDGVSNLVSILYFPNFEEGRGFASEGLLLIECCLNLIKDVLADSDINIRDEREALAFRMLLSAFNNAGWCGESQKGFRCTTLMREV